MPGVCSVLSVLEKLSCPAIGVAVCKHLCGIMGFAALLRLTMCGSHVVLVRPLPDVSGRLEPCQRIRKGTRQADAHNGRNS